jgi:hypothetical protein
MRAAQNMCVRLVLGRRMRYAMICCLLLVRCAGCNRAEKESKQLLKAVVVSFVHNYEYELTAIQVASMAID